MGSTSHIEAQGATSVIPPRANRSEPREYDRDEYKKHNVVERFINVLKQSRRVATRYEKTARNFLGFVLFVSTMAMLN
jgi:transposase